VIRLTIINEEVFNLIFNFTPPYNIILIKISPPHVLNSIDEFTQRGFTWKE
jgi:hypothetical protein